MKNKTIRQIIWRVILMMGVLYLAVYRPTLGENPTEIKPTITPAASSSSELAAQPPEGMTLAIVDRVVDGDTIKVRLSGRTFSLRLIGINTPETVAPNRPVGCYGPEASNYLKNFLKPGTTIGLEKDVSEVDKYNRLLRYVWLDNSLVNERLVRDGYAQASTYPPDVKYQHLFQEAEREARAQSRGMWSPHACTTITPKNTKNIPLTLGQTTESTSTISGRLDNACAGPDLDCTDFATQKQAQTFFDSCGFSAVNDPMNLDGVGMGDGMVCESLP